MHVLIDDAPYTKYNRLYEYVCLVAWMHVCNNKYIFTNYSYISWQQKNSVDTYWNEIPCKYKYSKVVYNIYKGLVIVDALNDACKLIISNGVRS